MVVRRYGRIVNVASVAAKEGNPNASAYSASKAAVIAMSKSLAKELVESGGVMVNTVTPAAVRTPIFEHGLSASSTLDFMLGRKFPVRPIPRDRVRSGRLADSAIGSPKP